MQSVRIYEIPECRMVSSAVGMFGQELFDAFGAWMEQQPRGIFPRDFLTWDEQEQGFRWLYLYEEGMDVPAPMEIIDFKGGLYAVATGIDQQTDKQAMDAQVEAFLAENGLARDDDRPEMGNIITTPAAKAILGYEQMDYYYPVKRQITGGERTMVRLELRDGNGQLLAQAGHAQEALLCVNRVYEEGDVIIVSCDDAAHLWVQMDETIPAGEVYIPEGKMTWRIPCGEHRRAYSPAAFVGKRHIASARKMTAEEVASRRNVAGNPADLRGDTDFYPHATANVETRGESVFAARNVIDGLRHNISHGDWPYQSWGIGAREDAWLRVDFGREVCVDEMALTLRADFPHDAYWVSGHVVLSDGAEVAYELEKTGDRQFIHLGQHKVSWIQLERMQKSDDPSAFPSLSEWEVFGHDA